tara:strand:+ start:39249 stop:39668 length:420 start_codon:yes stop_codon:yes gene_type:complete
MRNSIFLLTLFFAQICFGQEKQLSESYLIGRWTVDQTIKEGDFEITVYRRCTTSQIGRVLRFLTTGEYRISFNLARKIGRSCGNEVRPGVVNGYYRFNYKEQTVTFESYNTDPIINWDLMWFNENSFGVKKAKDNFNYN